MSRSVKIVSIILAALICAMLVFSIIDTKETEKATDFSKENMLAHIEKLSENGPRSIVDTEANNKALEYIASQIESYGVVNGDRTDKPAYLIQDYVAIDNNNKYQNFYLKNVIVHIPANAEKATGEAVMFMGHFDSVPMGQGASDDGVACATMLEAIRYYLDKMKSGYTISNDLVFCFVNGEEYNLFGSRAFMNEFNGFNDVVGRIRFGTNLESRGTDGTLIMFETSKNNYNTVKLFSEINSNLFTCSIATMVYDMMPNGTDFSNFKEAYQGLNMANIGGGENYHTQNDNPEEVGKTYLSQQAQIVDLIIERLGNYELEKLYDADESAIFFSYLNISTVVYNHIAVIVLATILLLMLIANILLSVFYRKQNNVARTAKSILALVIGLVLSAGITYLSYFVFQLIAALFGVIDIHMVGTITYSNIAIIIGIGLLVLATTVFVTHFACKIFKIERRDLTRAFAYTHAFLGIVISFVVADVSYLFVFSGILLLANELVITMVRKIDVSAYHADLLVTALYFPIVMPVIFLAASALGMTMAYVYGLVFALSIFNIGICITPLCKYFSIPYIVNIFRKRETNLSVTKGAMHILAISIILLFVTCIIKPNASVNLQGKQNIAKLPYDDALVYVCDANGSNEYRIYDLNAYRALEKYVPEMEYKGEYYAKEAKKQNITIKPLATANNDSLQIVKNTDESLVYLNFKNISAESFTIDDGKTSRTYEFDGESKYSISIHSNCVVTINSGKADVEYREVIRDYSVLIPDEYKNDNEKLHFNLWLVAEYSVED